MVEAKKCLSIVEMGTPEQPRFEIHTPLNNFVTQAIENEAHLVKPPTYTPENWERAVNMVILYCFGKEKGLSSDPLERNLSMQDIGEYFPFDKNPLFKQQVKLTIDNGIKHLWQNSPDSLKAQYSLEELLNQSKKPTFLVHKNGVARRIAGHVLTGASYQDLIDHEFNKFELDRARPMLESYNIKVPSPQESEHEQIITALHALTGQEPKEDVQKVLNRIKRSFQKSRREEFKAYCLAAGELSKMAGLHITTKKHEMDLVLQVLDDLGYAHGKILYQIKTGQQKGVKRENFILVAQKEQVITLLKEDKRLNVLRENPVKQICGEPLDQLPSTYQLKNKIGYEGLGVLLENLKLGTVRKISKIRARLWLSNCPVPVLTIKSRLSRYYYYYPKDQEEQLKTFLAQRLRSDLNPH